MSCCAALLLAFSAACLAADPTPRQLIDDGHYRRARALLEARLQSAPDDPEALALTAHLRLLGGEPDAALSLAERAVKLAPRDPLCHLELARVLSEALNRASAVQQIKLGNQFKSELQTVLSLDPNNAEALKFQYSIYHDAPAIFGGSKDKARQVADKILQIDPVQGYFLQVEIATAEKHPELQEGFYRKAVDANPKSYEARFHLAYYELRGAKNFPEAEIQAREAVRINPGRVEAREILVAAVAQQARWNELDPLLTDCEQSVPDDWRPYLTAASQMVAKGVEPDRAERYLQKYLSREPELFAPTHDAARARLGQLREKQQPPAPAAPRAYDAAHWTDIVRSISTGADSTERAQAITLRLARLGIAYESRPFVSGGQTGANIIATLAAPNSSAPVLMLGAHLDRVAAGNGAVDNASGAAAVLELLAALQRAPLSNYRVVAAFWDREEEGLLGSQTFVASQPRAQLPAVYLNFDMFGYGDTLCANWKDENAKSAAALRKAAADQFPLRADFEFPPSDDRSFLAADVEVLAIALGSKEDIDPGMKLLRGEDAKPPRILTIMHTAEDTPDKVAGPDAVRALSVIDRALRLM